MVEHQTEPTFERRASIWSPLARRRARQPRPERETGIHPGRIGPREEDRVACELSRQRREEGERDVQDRALRAPTRDDDKQSHTPTCDSSHHVPIPSRATAIASATDRNTVYCRPAPHRPPSAGRRPAHGHPHHAWAALPFLPAGRGRGSSAKRWTPLPRKPRGAGTSYPEAGRRPVRLLRRTTRDEHLETNTQRRTGAAPSRRPARASEVAKIAPRRSLEEKGHGAATAHPHRRTLNGRGRRPPRHPPLHRPRARAPRRTAGATRRPALAVPPRPHRRGRRAARRPTCLAS
jgi:hypothetical protein